MDIKVLKYFLAVAREGNITKAAESLHISQPSLSKQLMELEQEIAHWAKPDLEKLDIKATYNTVHGNPENFVLNDLGYFLTTRDLLPSNLADNICFLPLKPPINTHYALVWKKHSVFSNVAKAFIECF